MNDNPLLTLKFLSDGKGKDLGIGILVSVFSIVLSLLVGALIITAMGYNPWAAYAALLEGSMGSLVSVTITLKRSVPLILSGLAVAVAFKCSSFNIGVEGQLMVGALCSALVGVYVPLPSGIHLIVTLLAGIAGGMAFAFLPAILKSRCNVSVIISTILLNYIAQFFVQFCVMGPFHGNTSAQATLAIRKTAELPSITSKPYQLNLGFILMVVVVVLVYVLLNKTTRGYEMNAVGLNSIASEIQGINAERNMFLALVISGGIAGLAGGVEVTGTLHKMVNGFSTGYGFAGIPIALMARCNPFAILLTGFFFGLMKSGSFLMQSTVGVSSDMVGIIQGLVVAFLCTENVLRYYLERERG